MAGEHAHVVEEAIQNLLDALVAAQVGVHGQHLGDEDARPQVVIAALVIGAGAEPAVLALALENAVHILLRAADEILVLQQIGQRDEAVQPVGHALPAVAIAADPLAVAYIGPDLVQISAQTVGLNAQLAPEPALGLDFAVGKELKFGWIQHKNLPPMMFFSENRRQPAEPIAACTIHAT